MKAGKHMKMAQGKHITACPYGYKKKPGIKEKMFVDPETAPVVKEIFDSVIQGMKTTEIAASLNERGILTPAEYKKRSRKYFSSDAMWSHQAILRIIKDYKYTGAMVSFKCENRTIRAKAQHHRPPEEWVITENCHEPIISHEEYERANAKIRKIRKGMIKRSDGKDRVYYCGYCGRKLRKTFGLDEYYSCATQLYRKNSQCGTIFWSRKDIEEVVLTTYKAHLRLMNEEYLQTLKGPKLNLVKECRIRQAAISAELERSASKNLQLYEQYREGKLDKDTFLKKKGELIKCKKELQQELDSEQGKEKILQKEYKTRLEQEKYLAESGRLLQASDEELRLRMYDDIKKVTVYGAKEVDIVWKWEDIFAGMLIINQ